MAAKGKGKPGRRKLVVVLLAVILLGGLFGYFVLGEGAGLPFLSRSRGQGTERTEAREEGSKNARECRERRQIALEPLVVNLADRGGQHYLRVAITLEVMDPDVEKELNESGYRVRDAVIGALRSKTVADLAADRAEVLRKELLATINDRLVSGKVTGLYFEDMVVQ